jgi:hypothetical protein
VWTLSPSAWTSLTSRVDLLPASVHALAKPVDALAERVHAQPQRVHLLAERVDLLRESVRSLAPRVDALSSPVASVRDAWPTLAAMTTQLVAPPIVPLEILGSIRPSTYRALFDAHGYPPSLPVDQCASATLDAIVASLGPAATCNDFPVDLSRALITVTSFSSDGGGRVHVYNAAEALAYETRWPDAISPADLIALVVAASATDDRALELLQAAQILRDRDFRQWATFIYVGIAAVDPHIGDPAQYVEAWRREIAAWCKRRDFGAVIDVRVHTSGTKTTFEILHEDRTQTDVLVSPKTGKISTSTRRPVRTHFVTYDYATRRLSNTTNCMEAATPIALIAGSVFFGNVRHFFEEAALDLWALQQKGIKALSVPSLSDRIVATAIGGTWHSGKDHAMTPRGADFFKALARYKIGIDGGRLAQATLRGKRDAARARDGGPTQCDVAIRPPHQLTISEPELAPLMELFLDRARITDPPPRVRDFYSIQPWIDTRPVWELTLGKKGFADLLRRGILKEVSENRFVAPPDAPLGGRSAMAHHLRGDKYLACDPDPSIAPFIVREKDLVVYSLQFDELAAFIASELGLEGAATKLDDDGVLFCGRRELGGTWVHVFLPTRPIRRATEKRLSEAAESGHAVLIIPEARIKAGALRQLPMPNLAAPWFPLLGSIVRSLALQSKVETISYAPADARIVLHQKTMRMWVDRVPCKHVTEKAFKAIEALIVREGQAVHSKEVAEHIRSVACGEPAAHLVAGERARASASST